MPTLTIQLPRPHPGQLQILREKRRFNVVACGRRWGKSTLGVNLIAETTLTGYPFGWFAPTYKLLMEAWRDTIRVLRPVIKSANASDHRIELITGGVVEFWTLQDPDAGRSRKYKRAFVDEAGLVANLGETWQAAIRPTLADYAGDGWLAGTPKGRNYFWECYQKGLDPLQTNWACWQRPTEDNPHIPPLEVVAMRAELTERRAAQEIDAQFLDDGGGVFRNVLACSTGRRADPIADHQYVFGIDWGRSVDYTAISVWDILTRREVALDRFNSVEYPQQEGRVLALAERYKPIAILAEQNSIGDAIISNLRRRNLPIRPFVTSNASKAQIVDAFALDLERKAISLLNDPIATAELLAYEGTKLPSGLIRYSAPEGQHDDTVMARMIGHHAARRPREASSVPNPLY
ncbi:MAG: hypothetical protein M3R61_00105 [Chloroflexota bacterium]|nr:hypothetical protein [Chloroflexota bacterium]